MRYYDPGMTAAQSSPVYPAPPPPASTVPVPPHHSTIPGAVPFKSGGRGYPTTTPLGLIMRARNLRAYEVAGAARIAPRYLTEYLSGRKKIPPKHILSLSVALGVSGDVLQ